MGNASQRIELHLPTGTIVKLLVTSVLIWAAVRLWPQLFFLLLSLLLAVALEPIVARLAARRLSRGVSVMILAAILLAILGLTVGFVLPPLVEQALDITSRLPAWHSDVLARIPPDSLLLRRAVDQIFESPSSPQVAAELSKVFAWGQATVSGLVATLLVLILALYLIMEGRLLYAWLLAYVPRVHRKKVAATVPEVSRVVRAYVRGQLIISLMFSGFVGVVLTALGVPAVLPLAILAGVCDVVPVVGIIIATVPAALLALTVSVWSAAAVVVLFIVYHVFETYFIVPRLYGRSLRLSTLVVLLALIIGGTLQGILGAVLILPLVAAYPIIERIWLKSYLAPQVIADHIALGESGSEQAVQAVLHGEEHPAERVSAWPGMLGAVAVRNQRPEG